MEDVTADNEEVNTAKNVPEGEPRLEEDAVQEIITEVFVMDPAKNGNKPQVPPTCSSTLHKVNCKSSSLSTMEAQKATSQSDDAPNSSSLTAAPPVASEGTSTVTSLVESSQKVQSSLVIPNTGRPIPVLLCKSDSTSVSGMEIVENIHVPGLTKPNEKSAVLLIHSAPTTSPTETSATTAASQTNTETDQSGSPPKKKARLKKREIAGSEMDDGQESEARPVIEHSVGSDRRSGRIPARRRVVPQKFRDYKNPDSLDIEMNGGDDKEITIDIVSTKPVRKGGRPRKVAVESGASLSQEAEEEGAGEADSGDKNKQDGDGSEQDTKQTGKEKDEDYVGDASESDSDRALSEPRRRGRPCKGVTAQSKEELVQLHKCEDCGKHFSQKGNLKVHQLIHAGLRPFACSEEGCSKSFRSNAGLQRHRLAAHLGIKLFQCEVCETRFSSNIALQEHMSRHSNTKPLECEVCSRKFRQLSCLRRHLTTHSSETPFSCELCGKKFSQMVYLRSHSKVHTGERPFKCTLCGRSFAHLSDLNRHKIIHTGEKPYPCDVCGARFSDPSSRRRHVREHEGTKPYHCQLCGESFKRTGQLKVHLKKKHTDFSTEDESGAAKPQSGQNNFAYNLKGIQQLVSSFGAHVQAEILDSSGKTLYVQTVESKKDTGESTVIVTEQVPITGENSGMDSDTSEPEDVSEQGASVSASNETSTVNQEDMTASYQSDLTEGKEGGQDGGATTKVVAIQSANQELQIPSEPGMQLQYQLIENTDPDAQGQQILEIHYQQVENPEQPAEQAVESSSSQPAQQVPATAQTTPTDFVANPNFNSQEYYNWLSNFTELCKLVPMPLDVELFQKISQVHKTLSDVLATPTGILTNRENFRILMSISKDLNEFINEHLAYVLDNLDTSEKT